MAKLLTISLNQTHSASVDDSLTYHIQSTPVQPTTVQHDLGIILTSNLSWNEHYNAISSKAYHSLNERMDDSFIHSLIHSFIHSFIHSE